MTTRITSCLFALLIGAGFAEFEKKHLETRFFCEGASVGDINKDGNPDIVSGPYWYAGPSFETKTEIYFPRPYPPASYSENFFSWTCDFNQDGWIDVLVVGFPGKAAVWFENPQGKEGHWQEHIAVDVVDNESPNFTDMTGDGQPDLCFSQDGIFTLGSFDPKKPAEKWALRKITGKVTGGKFTHGLGYGDVNGDGRVDLLAKDGWWEQPIGEGEWVRHGINFSPGGGAQMYVYDFDGDGDNDVLTSLAAHSYGLAWFENTDGDAFKPHIIMSHKNEPGPLNLSFSQLHAIELIDMNGDGVKDIVTGKRYWAHNSKDPGGNDPAVLYWFETKPGGKSGECTFVPHKIDDDSGVGTQVTVTDVNGNGKPDIIVGNKKGTFVHLQ
jgi:hypothetical protein